MNDIISLNSIKRVLCSIASPASFELRIELLMHYSRWDEFQAWDNST